MTRSIVFLKPCKCNHRESAAAPNWKPKADEKAMAKEVEVKLSPLFTSPVQRAFSLTFSYWYIVKVVIVRYEMAVLMGDFIIIYTLLVWAFLGLLSTAHKLADFKVCLLYVKYECMQLLQKSNFTVHMRQKGISTVVQSPYKRKYLKRKTSGKLLLF